MNCEQTAQLISLKMDQPLPLLKRWALRVHLLYCLGCRRYQAQAVMLRSLLNSCDTRCDHQSSSGLHLSPEMKAEIKSTLKKYTHY